MLADLKMSALSNWVSASQISQPKPVKYQEAAQEAYILRRNCEPWRGPFPRIPGNPSTAGHRVWLILLILHGCCEARWCDRLSLAELAAARSVPQRTEINRVALQNVKTTS